MMGGGGGGDCIIDLVHRRCGREKFNVFRTILPNHFSIWKSVKILGVNFPQSFVYPTYFVSFLGVWIFRRR